MYVPEFVYVYHMCAGACAVRRRVWVPWSWSYRQMRATIGLGEGNPSPLQWEAPSTDEPSILFPFGFSSHLSGLLCLKASGMQ